MRRPGATVTGMARRSTLCSGTFATASTTIWIEVDRIATRRFSTRTSEPISLASFTLRPSIRGRRAPKGSWSSACSRKARTLSTATSASPCTRRSISRCPSSKGRRARARPRSSCASSRWRWRAASGWPSCRRTPRRCETSRRKWGRRSRVTGAKALPKRASCSKPTLPTRLPASTSPSAAKAIGKGPSIR